jgi:hypothetical protein
MVEKASIAYRLGGSRGFRLLASGLVLLAAGSASAALLLYEPFRYPNGTLLGKNLGTNGWGVGASAGADGLVVTNGAALTYPGLVPGSGSAGLLFAGTPAVDRSVGNTNFPPLTLNSNTPAIYCSFLLSVQAPTTVTPNRMLVSLYCQDSDAGAIAGAGVCIDSANQLYVTKKSNTPDTSPTAPLAAGTHLVVLRYLAKNGDQPASLWVDPPDLGTNENSLPPASATTSAHDNVQGSFRAVYLYQSAGYTGTYYVDEIRAGTTWADVTPLYVGQVASATNCSLAVSPAATNVNAAVLITVTERDWHNLALTNAGSVPVLAAATGTLGPVTLVSNGVYTATLTGAVPGYDSVTGTVDGTPIGDGTGASAYFAGLIGTSGNFDVGAGFFPGTYNINFLAAPGQSFTVWSSPDPSQPMAQWFQETDQATGNLTMYETTYPGQPSSYSFTVAPPASGQVFYRVGSP